MNIYWFVFRYRYDFRSNVGHQLHQAEIQLKHRVFKVRTYVYRQRDIRRQVSSMLVYYAIGAIRGRRDTELQRRQTRLCKNCDCFLIVSS